VSESSLLQVWQCQKSNSVNTLIFVGKHTKLHWQPKTWSLQWQKNI
jgi:hypothetical protein